MRPRTLAASHTRRRVDTEILVSDDDDPYFTLQSVHRTHPAQCGTLGSRSLKTKAGHVAYNVTRKQHPHHTNMCIKDIDLLQDVQHTLTIECNYKLCQQCSYAHTTAQTRPTPLHPATHLPRSGAVQGSKRPLTSSGGVDPGSSSSGVAIRRVSVT